MDNIQLHVNKQDISTDTHYLVSGTENLYVCQFHFDNEWDGYTKYIVFNFKNQFVKLPMFSDEYTIPDYVVAHRGNIRIGVCGTKGDKKITTVFTDDIFVKFGASEGAEPPEPTPTQWDIIQQELEEIHQLLAEMYIKE